MIIIKLYNGRRIEAMYWTEDNKGFNVSSSAPGSFSNVIRFYAHSDIVEITEF